MKLNRAEEKVFFSPFFLCQHRAQFEEPRISAKLNWRSAGSLSQARKSNPGVPLR